MLATATSTTSTILSIYPRVTKGCTLSVISLFPRGAFGNEGGKLHTSLTRALTSLRPHFIHFPNKYITRKSNISGVCS